MERQPPGYREGLEAAIAAIEGLVGVDVATLILAREAVCDLLRAAPAPLEALWEPQIQCPLCDVVVKQVASATLDLALWQHVNWVCSGRAVVPSPPGDPLPRPPSDWMLPVRWDGTDLLGADKRILVWEGEAGERTGRYLEKLINAAGLDAAEVPRPTKP